MEEIRYGMYGGVMGSPANGVISQMNSMRNQSDISHNTACMLAQQQANQTGHQLSHHRRILEDIEKRDKAQIKVPASTFFGLDRFKKPVRMEQKKMSFVKEYFTKHRELFMGLAIAIILDRYLLGGAFQDRLKRIVTSLLDKTEGALAIDHAPKV